MKIIDGLLAELEQEADDDTACARADTAGASVVAAASRSRCRSVSSRCTSPRCPVLSPSLRRLTSFPRRPHSSNQRRRPPQNSCPRWPRVSRRRSALLGTYDDAKMAATWRLQSGGRDVMAMPRVAFVRAIMLNHWYHHRGQLLVYLRLLNLPVPSVYGPTADENPFAA